MVRAEHFLTNRQRAPVERLGVGIATLVLVEPRRIAQQERDAGIVATARLLLDRQRVGRAVLRLHKVSSLALSIWSVRRTGPFLRTVLGVCAKASILRYAISAAMRGSLISSRKHVPRLRGDHAQKSRAKKASAYARFSTFALRSGTPNSRRQTSASTATPSRICSTEGLAKQSRRRLLE